MCIHLSICCAAYLRSHASSDHNFWYMYVKWWYLQLFFFQFLKISIFCLKRGVKGQKTVQNDQTFCLSCSITIHHMIVVYGTLVLNDNISWYFFIFSKFWIFGLLRCKSEKLVQNDKKFCQSLSVSQEPCIIWLSSMLHLCKMTISPGNFFIFSKYFFGC